jgi:hypothetical protein
MSPAGGIVGFGQDWPRSANAWLFALPTAAEKTWLTPPSSTSDG